MRPFLAAMSALSPPPMPPLLSASAQPQLAAPPPHAPWLLLPVTTKTSVAPHWTASASSAQHNQSAAAMAAVEATGPEVSRVRARVLLAAALGDALRVFGRSLGKFKPEPVTLNPKP
jgi:hypothetical protein